MAEAKNKPRLKLRRDYDHKIHGAGDTLEELKNPCPGVYLKGLNDPECY